MKASLSVLDYVTPSHHFVLKANHRPTMDDDDPIYRTVKCTIVAQNHINKQEYGTIVCKKLLRRPVVPVQTKNRKKEMRSSSTWVGFCVITMLLSTSECFQPISLSSHKSTLKHIHRKHARPLSTTRALKDASTTDMQQATVWEELAKTFHPGDISTNIEELRAYSQTVTLLRVGIPSLFLSASLKIAYPTVAITLANLINDSGVFAVVAQDASQYIQNILTTSGLMFSILVGQTYYFMYQQQEAVRVSSCSNMCKIY